MASKRAAAPAKHLFNGFRAYQQPNLTRSMATEAALPASTPTAAPPPPTPTTPSATPVTIKSGAYQPPRNPFLSTTSCTLYSFPSFEPMSFSSYPSTHLLIPLRRDILHRAVIFEGDSMRQGTASTKHRSEVHGSSRKIRPQKGTGRARLGDKKSPMLRGGGVAFGPKPRDFSTDLQQKVYDLAWRMALSYRYRMGQLIVTDGEVDVPGVHEDSMERYLTEIFDWNGMERKTLFLAAERREALFGAVEANKRVQHRAKVMEVDSLRVRDLLKCQRLVVERSVLDQILREHESDLPLRHRWAAWQGMLPTSKGEQAEARA